MVSISQPVLTTARLLLRPFKLSDAGCFQRLAGDRAVADTTERIPHPYEDGMAEFWIATLSQQFHDRQECTFRNSAEGNVGADRVHQPDAEYDASPGRTVLLDQAPILESRLLFRGDQSGRGFWLQNP